MTGSHGGESESSSSQEVQELEVDGYWHPDSIRAGDTLFYTAEVDSGVTYKVFWDDAYQGSTEYSADIAVAAADSGEDLGYWFGFADNGYQGRSFKAVGPVLLIRVISYDDIEDEDSPARSFALAIDYVTRSSSSSSGKLSSARSSSSCMASSMSSGYKPSSSSSFATGYSSLSYPSSSSNGKALNLDVDHQWTEVHLRYGDTLTYLTSVQPGTQYTVQWMDSYDYLEDEIQGDHYPTADVEATLVNGGTTLFTEKGDGAVPYTFYANTSQLKMVLQPNYSKLDTGIFFMRIYNRNLKTKSLKVSTDWHKDTIYMNSDSIEYAVDLELNKQYRIDIIDDGFSSVYSNTRVTGNYTLPIASSSSSGSRPLLFSRQVSGYVIPKSFIATSTKLSLKISAFSAGFFQVRVVPLEEPYSRIVLPDNEWNPEFMGSQDTVVFKIPTSDSMTYQIQVDNQFGSGWFDCPYGFQYKLSSTGAWLTTIDGINSIPGEIQDSYHTIARVKPTGDTLYVRIISTYRDISFFTLLFRVKSFGIPLRHIQIPNVGSWNQYTQNAGDTTIVHAGITKGQTYQIQWDDVSEGSGRGAIADVKFWFKDGSTGNWVGFIQNGYNTMVRVTPKSDSLYLKFTGTPGIFWYRLLPYAPKEVTLDVNSEDWRRDTIRQIDTIWYLAKNLNVGETYRLLWKDAADSMGFANIKVDAFMADKITRYPVTWMESGSTLNTIVPEETTIWFRATGSPSSQFGPFRIRFDQISGALPKVLPAGKTWESGIIETYDTLSFNIPVSIGKQYRVQISSSTPNIHLSVNDGLFSKDAMLGDLVHFAEEDTLHIRIANSVNYISSLYSIRIYEIVPVNLDWSLDFPIWVDSYLLEPYDMVAFEVTGLEFDKIYQLSWNDGLQGTGEYNAQVQVSIRQQDTGNLVMTPRNYGYLNPHLFAAPSSKAYIYVSAQSAGGQFAISLRPY